MKKSVVASLTSRLLWHANRTPAAAAIKWGLRAVHRREVSHRRALARGLALSSAERSLAQALNRDGFVAIGSIVDPATLLALLQAADDKYVRASELEHRQESAHKSFWVRLLDEDSENGALPSDNPFVRFATQRPIIALLAGALGEVPQLSDVLLTLSRDSGSNLSYSQLWHRDYDDIRTLKLFAYLTDVPDTARGPFTFLLGPASDRFGRSLRSHLTDAEISRTVAASDVRELIGPRCTTFIVETSRCLHMGSRVAAGHQRLMYTATFVTAPRPYIEPPPRFVHRGDLDTITQTVLFRHTR